MKIKHTESSLRLSSLDRLSRATEAFRLHTRQRRRKALLLACLAAVILLLAARLLVRPS